MARDNRFGGRGWPAKGGWANVGYKTVKVNNRKMLQQINQ